MTSRRLVHYELRERIGQGGMGLVYRAVDTRVGTTVAVKVLPAASGAQPERRSRFLREARAEAAVSHPGIAAFFDLGEADVDDPELLGASGGRRPHARRVVYLVMEYVPGEDLRALLARRSLDPREALEIAAQVAEALEAAHAAGVVHRDLKPGNIRITPDGRVKLLDFGLAKILKSNEPPQGRPPTLLTSPGMILGTVPYMAPEQVLGAAVDARTDLFTLGVVLYQMLCGRVPFRGGNPVEALRAITERDPEPLARAVPGLAPAVERIVTRLLAKQPTARYASARKVAADLRAAARGEEPRPHPNQEDLMAETVSQSYATHRRVVPLFHVVTLGLLALNLLYRGWALARDVSAATVFDLLLAVALGLLAYWVRIFPLTVQDRVIRLEERLRLERLCPDLGARRGRLSRGQLVALRFASDAELPELARRVLDEDIRERDAIKRLVRDWRPDTLRV